MPGGPWARDDLTRPDAVDATVVGVSEYSPARLECAVPHGAGGYDGRTRRCVATALKLGFKLGSGGADRM